MVIDLMRCVGCASCATTCKEENGTPPGVTRAKVMKKELGKYPNVRRIILPMLCMQCKEPPCVDVCPSGATRKDTVSGVVTVDKDVCIGCHACATACPYGARYYRENEEGYFGAQLTPYEEVLYKNMPAGVVDKCDFCIGRVEQGLEPACVQSCVVKARIFGKEEDLAELVKERKGRQLRPEFGTDPSVWYLE